MNCPKCKSENKVKNGIIKGKQRYKCITCNYNYTVDKKSTAKSIDIRKFGLMMYLEGLGFQSIGRLLNVNHVAVIKWIKKYGEQINELKTENKPVKVIELNEIHSYIGQKKYRWIWTAVNREGKRLIDFVIGDRITKTGKKLWKKIKKIKTELIMADYWKSYKEFVPKKLLVQSKKQTYTVECYNGIIRHFLARFRRKSKCYSKSEKMMQYSLALLVAKRNI